MTWPFKHRHDAGFGEALPRAPRPIKIHRVPLENGPIYLTSGDRLNCTLHTAGRPPERMPTYEPEEPMTIDCCVKIEVVDDFGLDVGVGWLFGRARQ